MDFRTEIELPDYDFHLSYTSTVTLMGSCFSDHMGRKLERYKFRSQSNPLGISFNPVSIANQLDYILGKRPLDRRDLAFRDGLWHHFDFHGRFSFPDRELAFRKLEESIRLTREVLFRSNVLFITLGTAMVFERRSTGRVVANNHKFPIGEFSARRLNVEEIVAVFSKIIPLLREENPAIRLVFTVSPVRYTREGLIGNQRSKATLLLAVDALEKLPGVHYFPSYEIFNDDLRDYRFYTGDMLHPGDLGIDYTWAKFRQAFFNAETLPLYNEVRRLVRSAEHRPIHPGSDLHRAFLLRLRDQILELTGNHPFLDFGPELEQIDSQLA
jgi:hypothetical protein